MTKKATKAAKAKPTAAKAKPAAQKPAPKADEWTPPALRPFSVTITFDIDAAAHGTAQLLASDIASAANDAAMEFCDHVLRVYSVTTEVNEQPEYP